MPVPQLHPAATPRLPRLTIHLGHLGHLSGALRILSRIKLTYMKAFHSASISSLDFQAENADLPSSFLGEKLSQRSTTFPLHPRGGSNGQRRRQDMSTPDRRVARERYSVDCISNACSNALHILSPSSLVLGLSGAPSPLDYSTLSKSPSFACPSAVQLNHKPVSCSVDCLAQIHGVSRFLPTEAGDSLTRNDIPSQPVEPLVRNPC